MTTEPERQQARGADCRADAQPAASCRSFDSRDLLAGAREVTITHGDSTYRLRATSTGKLLLTK